MEQGWLHENKDVDFKWLMIDFEHGFKLEQGMVWEMIEWVLKGYWLTIYMRSILDCWRIEKGKNKFWEKGKK